MNAPAYEARTMHHPQFRKGKMTEVKGNDPVSGRPFTDYQGEPDVLPDVTVKDPETEAYYRSRGYLFSGETAAPPAEYSEYPVMLVHPDHVDAVPDEVIQQLGEHGQITTLRIPGKPEVHPPKPAASASEERKLGTQGYRRAGHDNPDAIRTAKASPHRPGAQTKEWPKMVNGNIVDPDAPVGGPAEYPKWVGDKIVNSRAEEEALTGKKATATVVETCVICGEWIAPDQPKGKGANGAFHLSHMGDAATKPQKAAKPPKNAAPQKAKAAPKVPAAPPPPAGISRRQARLAADAAGKAAE